MHIYELDPGSKVHISVTVKGNKLEFDTVIKAGGSGCAKCEPIMADGKRVGFGNAAVRATATNLSDGREYIYPVNRTANRSDGFLYLYCNANVAPVNHRESFRVPCGYRVVMQIGANKATQEGIVHDISYSGAAYVIKKSTRIIAVGSAISVTIYDEEETAYKIKGSIVRTVEDYDEGHTLLGVQFTEQVQSIVSLVARLNIKAARVRGT